MARIELAGLAHSYKANPSEPSDYALRPMEMTWNDGGGIHHGCSARGKQIR